MIARTPIRFEKLLKKSNEIGFTMRSDKDAGALLRTLVTSKPGGNFLELGTGMGLSLSWMVAGMDSSSKMVSVDNDQDLVDLVGQEFEEETNVSITCRDGAEWVSNYTGPTFDLIFADAWPGKYELLEETLALLKPGGLYVIDDMLEQPNWPEGHAEKAQKLSDYLLSRQDLTVTRLDWSTGIFICTKTAPVS